MTDALTKAAQAALDALDNAIDHLPKPYSTGCSNAATDLRAALAAQQAPDLIPQDALFSCPQMGNSVTRVTQQAAQPVARPDGRLHADGYFTWTRRDGYVLDAKLPCDFYLAAQPQQAADELGWLIEMQFGDGLLWWSGCFDDDGTYPPSRLIARMVNDVNKAVRFSRREDAQRVLDAMLAAQPCPLLARAKTLYSVHEHMWPEAAQPQQAEGDTP